MTREEIQVIADSAADKAINRVFLAMGIDASEPKGLLEMQADLIHVRKWRRVVEQTERLTAGVFISVLVTGVLGMLWLGLRDMLGK